MKECKVCRDNIVKTLNKKRICVIHGGITMVNKEVLLFRDLCSRVARELKEVRKDSRKHLSENEHLVLSQHLDYARIGIERLVKKLSKKLE